jgi:CDP-diacylglycerol--glycerol-3-phosphate 3-phosphatidyltransferase
MNLPNKLTCSRFVFSALILFFLSFDFPFAKTLALLLFVLASITDWLDGHLARGKYGTSDFGKLMDPLADKVMVCVALVGMVEFRMKYYLPEWPMVPAFMVSLMLVREFMVTGLRLLAVEKGVVISAGSMGKWKTVLQIIAISFTMIAMAVLRDLLRHADPSMIKSAEFTFRWLIWGLMAVATGITLYSGFDYFKQHRTLILPHEPTH